MQTTATGIMVYQRKGYRIKDRGKIKSDIFGEICPQLVYNASGRKCLFLCRK